MVPSRSRKTTGRKAFASGKALAPYARSLGAVARNQQRMGRFKGALDRNASHATMIDGACAEKTGAALHWIANQRELRRHGFGAFGGGGGVYTHTRNSDCARDVHRSGIIADKEAAGREQRGKFTDFSRADQVAGAMAHRANNARRHPIFLWCAEKYDVRLERTDQPVRERRVAFRFPALRGPVSRAGSESNPDCILAHSCSKQALQSPLSILVRHADADFIDVGQAFQPSSAAD